MAPRTAFLTAALLGVAGPLACLQDDGTRFNPIAEITTVSEDDERELGLAFDQELRQKVVVIEDPVVADFINALGQEIVRGIQPQPFLYRFRIIQDPSLNAFAVPGGYVYFHSGTVLAASSIDELAGVMGHEIAHVNGHHYARMKKKTQIPDLVAGLAGIGVAVATQEPGAVVATQAANVAIQLRFSREFETEADRFGAVFVTRAGFDPAGSTRFFERILDEQEQHPHDLPPYLFSHPDVEDRIGAVRIQARELRPTRSADPRFEEALHDTQGRLAYLLDRKRDSVPPHATPPDRDATDPLLAEADRLADGGRVDEAMVVLARAEAVEPNDPRVPFRIGELLAERGRHQAAVDAYRRTIRLDPTHALVFYRLGISHKALGDGTSAVAAFEQASRRAGANSDLRERADWQIETQIFPVLLETGLAVGDDPVGRNLDVFPHGVQRITWWARLSRRFDGYPDKMRVRWVSPRGAVVGETPVKRLEGSYLGSRLQLAAPGATTAGTWTAEARYQDEVLERWRFQVQPSM
jgi:predicted Zn-dependent protease